MKKLIQVIVLITILSLVLIYRTEIQRYILEKFIFPNEYEVITYNEYSLEYNTLYQKYENEEITNKTDLSNMLFTILNSGEDEFSFLCSYDECVNDLNNYFEDDSKLNLNNYVHPFNSYKVINMKINSLDKISITPTKLYTDEHITMVNTEIDRIITEVITEDMDITTKIKAFHDYVINNTKYDSESLEDNLNDMNNPSNTAYGTLINHLALCGGYTDTMAIFLNRLGLENHKLSSTNHVWNYVKIDENWFHLDLTWDDPVTNTNDDILIHKFFLITDSELKELNTENHDYIISES